MTTIAMAGIEGAEWVVLGAIVLLPVLALLAAVALVVWLVRRSRRRADPAD